MAAKAPMNESGADSMIVNGCRKELNCAARIM